MKMDSEFLILVCCFEPEAADPLNIARVFAIYCAWISSLLWWPRFHKCYFDLSLNVFFV